jgi:hypothetical protein
MQSAKCKGQNEGKDAFLDHSVLQFEIYNLHFALIAAIGRAVNGGCDEL